MKRQILKGSTDVTEYVFIQDSSSAVGAGLTGLVWNAAGLVASQVRPLAARVAITLATQTVTGAHSNGGFVEVDATNMPGVYRFDPPDTVYATGVPSVVVMLKGATNMVPLVLEIQLLDFDLNEADVAVNFKRAILGDVRGTASGTPTTTSIPTSSLVPAAAVTDQFKGRILTFDKDTTTTNLRGQATDITASTAAGVLTVSALTTAPVSGDTFVIT